MDVSLDFIFFAHRYMQLQFEPAFCTMGLYMHYASCILKQC